jgi:hypothetical protein
VDLTDKVAPEGLFLLWTFFTFSKDRMDWLRRIVRIIRRYQGIYHLCIGLLVGSWGVYQLICTNIHYMKSELVNWYIPGVGLI